MRAVTALKLLAEWHKDIQPIVLPVIPKYSLPEEVEEETPKGQGNSVYLENCHRNGDNESSNSRSRMNSLPFNGTDKPWC